ncbi:hypothetical protein PoB_004476600 [Plakobranchus ocellatus]|uniref:Uncharacterized protein n=1 Tax=Plakobranchus ocellatus TaxID=259542 RepID=A0AAV4BCX4_9GAST|nr:hypothetical protein PoB_004476600 [Plakobranchus ocellatus]
MTGGIRAIPITAMESLSGIHSLELRKVSTTLIQAKKLKRLPSHQMKERCKTTSRSQLKRISFAQHSNSLKRILNIPTEDADTLHSFPTALTTKLKSQLLNMLHH